MLQNLNLYLTSTNLNQKKIIFKSFYYNHLHIYTKLVRLIFIYFKYKIKMDVSVLEIMLNVAKYVQNPFLNEF